ncbi:MAG: phosphoribosylaminoimidazolesuccinocarboxamide synthase [Patescibacteria group bacterium]
MEGSISLRWFDINSQHRHTLAVQHRLRSYCGRIFGRGNGNQNRPSVPNVDRLIVGAGWANHLSGCDDAFLRNVLQDSHIRVYAVAFEDEDPEKTKAAISSIIHVPGTRVIFRDYVGAEGFLRACIHAVNDREEDLPVIELKPIKPQMRLKFPDALAMAIEIARKKGLTNFLENRYVQQNARRRDMIQEEILRETNFTDIGIPKRGKVRDVYDLGDKLLIVVTDRLSAFDVVLPTGIVSKGKVLNQLSGFWFWFFRDLIRSHLISMDVFKYPEICDSYRDILRGRSMLVWKAKPILAECVVRGYLAGSGWKDYQETGMICGIQLPAGLQESQKLSKPIFTPTTKVEEGHDESKTFSELCELICPETSRRIRELSLKIYIEASKFAEERGIIVADTKLEFGMLNNEIIVIDEMLTPDSSRFWSMEKYEVGRGQDSLDKQPVRDYLETLSWDKTYPGPELPTFVSEQTAYRYRKIFTILTGNSIK